MKTFRFLSLLFGCAAFSVASMFAQATSSDAGPPSSATPAADAPASPAADKSVPPAPAAATPSANADISAAPTSPALRDLGAPGAKSATESSTKTDEPPAPPAAPERPAPPPPSEQPEHPHDGHRKEVATFGDAFLPQGEHGQVVVAVMGDATAHGPVDEGVIAVMGDSHATDTVGQAVVAVFGDATAESDVGQDVVAVFGDARVGGRVRGQVVSVFGDVILGPKARVEGQVVSVGGDVQRDPSSVVLGNTSEVPFFHHLPALGALAAWFHHGLGHGRLVAFGPQLGWVWCVALGFFVLYLVLTLAFGKAVTRCVETFEQRPGRTVLAAFLSFIIAPPLMIPLGITIVGLIAFLVALILALVIGKAAFLAWVGRRLGGDAARSKVAVAVLIGGLVTLLLYFVPVLGLLFWCAGSALGLGMAVYTTILTLRRERTPRVAASTTGSAPPFKPVAPSNPVVPQPGPFGAAGIVAPAAASATVAEPAAVVPPPTTEPASFEVATPLPSANTPSAGSTVPTAGAIPPAFAARTAAPPVSASSLPRAGFWIRLAASVLDVIIVAIIGHVTHLGEYFLLLFTVYCVTLWALRATTIGGIICGLKLVRVDDRPVDWSVAIVRSLTAFLSLFVIGLGFVWVAFDAEMQSWHDKVAGTVIVQVPKGTPLV